MKSLLKIIKRINLHIVAVLIFLAISILSNIDTLEWDKVRPGDALSLDYNVYPFVKETVLEYRQFPHWTPAQLGGMPFFANSENAVLNFWQFLFLFVPVSIENLINIKIILIPLIAGSCMYFLMIYLKFEPKIAFISGLIYMSNGLVRTWSYSWSFRADAIAILPLIFLFLLKAFNSDLPIKDSIIVGILLCLPVLGGGLVPFVWFPILFACFFGIYLLGSGLKKRIIKIAVMMIIILVVFLGMTAIKLLPLLEFSKVSSKVQGFGYADFIGQHYDIKDWKSILLIPVADPYPGNPARVGVVGFLLAIVSILYFRKRVVILFWILATLTFLISIGSIINYPLWRFFPVIGKGHHVYRSMFLWVFSISVLAAYGINFLRDYLKNSFKLKNKALNLIFIVILILILFELVYVDIGYEKRVPMDFKKQIEENHLLQYVSEQPGIFRIQNIGTFGIGGWANSVATKLDLQILYGTSAIWIPDYMNVYLGIGNNLPAKFWGMLNTKYVYSKVPLNSSEIKIDVSGLTFVRKFEECSICQEDINVDKGIAGPYLYMNDYYLPRAYLANFSILVAGNKDSVIQAMYWLMLNEHFNPSNTVIIAKEGSIDQFDLETLKKFTVVFLTQDSISQNSIYLLKSYTDNGGILLPNIVNGSTNINQEEIENLLDSFKGDYNNVNEVPYAYYSPNKQILNISGKKGFIVISEKYFMFEGWKAKMNDKFEHISRADGINSAVYSDGSKEKLELYYRPKSFFMGLYITMATLFFIIIYFGYDFVKNTVLKHRAHS